MLSGSLIAAIVVAVFAYWIAKSRAKAESRERLTSITKVFSETNFPLTQNVMQMLASLTDAYWMKLNTEGRVVEFALPLVSSADSRSRALSGSDLEKAKVLYGTSEDIHVQIEGRIYDAVLFKGQGSRLAFTGAERQDLLVMLGDTRQNQAVIQAAIPPLLTGLATIVLLGSLSLLLAERMVKRIGGLQKEVNRIAAGNFDLPFNEKSHDEIDQLANALRAMSKRLDQMWAALRQTQSQQMINQIASGLAHNLRNTLTGARLAVELLAHPKFPNSDQACDAQSTKPQHQNPALQVAIEQIQHAEKYIQRLLLMAHRREAEPSKPMLISDCMNSLKAGLGNTAAHRSVKIHWEIDPLLDELWVGDGASLLSAISNLVWNAMEAGKHVWVSAEFKASTRVCLIEVIDDGSGPPLSIRVSMLEPFVSSKPEGIGLGLPLVCQAAGILQGSLDWCFREERTVFRFQFPITKI
jgi:signal transduction histidine kinase